ncbi:hypothetical protein Acsp07_11130 [Actinomycetospora sp. NBRC 106378]|nr:Uma2 family endonuclease [Actinomycetospora sp. NBRC 106378]GLZ51496.1 hypothetical protein Acsp07_11130 [Actinomycetospora sp. NBRC 106378]
MVDRHHREGGVGAGLDADRGGHDGEPGRLCGSPPPEWNRSRLGCVGGRRSEAELAVEVLSPGSRRLDRIVKFHEYADAGIPTYLVVDPGPPVELTEFSLVEGGYRQVAVHRGTAALQLGVTLDLDALT